MLSLALDITFAQFIHWGFLHCLCPSPSLIESAASNRGISTCTKSCNKGHVISKSALLPTVATSEWNKQPLCHTWCFVTLHLKTSLTDATHLTRHLRKQPFPAQTCRGFSRSVCFPPEETAAGMGGRGSRAYSLLHACIVALRRRTRPLASKLHQTVGRVDLRAPPRADPKSRARCVHGDAHEAVHEDGCGALAVEN